MKFISILIIPFLLSGCVYQTVDSFDLKNAIKHCGSIEEVYKIESHFGGSEVIYCFNNTSKSQR